MSSPAIKRTRSPMTMGSLKTRPDQPIPPRLVSVLWYVPIFMEWQIDRVRENGGDIAEYTAAIAKFTAEIERILGALDGRGL
jgi:hypothetical protein